MTGFGELDQELLDTLFDDPPIIHVWRSHIITPGAEVWYRYQDSLINDNTVLLEIEVIKHTPKGAWLIEPGSGRRRFVLSKSHKKYAAATKYDALESYIQRKKRQIRIMKHRLSVAEAREYNAIRMLAELKNGS